MSIAAGTSLKLAAAAAALVILCSCAASGKERKADAVSEGLGLVSQGTPVAAIKLLSGALEKDYSNPAVTRALVHAYDEAGRSMEAYNLYLSFKDRQPAWISLYGRAMALFSADPARAQDAVRLMQEALKIAPSEPELHQRLGMMHLEMESFQDACRELGEAQKLAPSNPSMKPAIAHCLLRTGDIAGARSELGGLLTLNPSKKDVELARAVMNQINNPLLSIPVSLEADYMKAVDYMDKYDAPAKAIDVLEPMAGAHTDCAPVRLVLGMAYSRIGDNARAVAELRAATELAPNSPQAWQALGGVYQGLEKVDAAETCYRKAIALDPLSSPSIAQLASILVDRGDYDQAIPLFRSLIKLEGESDETLFMLGRTLQLSGKLDEAEAEFRKMEAKNPDSAHALTGLGLVYAAKSDREKDPVKKRDLRIKAWDEAAAALKADPNFEAAKKLVDMLRAQK